MISTIMFAGTLPAIALIIAFIKSPEFFKRLAFRFPMTIEIMATLFFFFAITQISQSAIAVFAVFWADIIWTAFFFWSKSKQKPAEQASQ
jgi:hypothetical protein